MDAFRKKWCRWQRQLGCLAARQRLLQAVHSGKDGAADLVDDLLHAVLELEGHHQLFDLLAHLQATFCQFAGTLVQTTHGCVHLRHHALDRFLGSLDHLRVALALLRRLRQRALHAVGKTVHRVTDAPAGVA